MEGGDPVIAGANVCITADIVVVYFNAGRSDPEFAKSIVSLLAGLSTNCETVSLPLLPNSILSLTFKYCIVLGIPDLFSDHASVAFTDELCRCVLKQAAGASSQRSRILPIYTDEVSSTTLWHILPSLACHMPLRWKSVADVLTSFLHETAMTSKETRFVSCQLASNDLLGFERIWQNSSEYSQIDSLWNLSTVEDAGQKKAFYIAKCSSESGIVGCRVLSIDGIRLTKDDLQFFEIQKEFGGSFSFEIQRPVNVSSFDHEIKFLQSKVEKIRDLEALQNQEELNRLLGDVGRFINGKRTPPTDLPRLLALASIVGINAENYKTVHEFSVDYPDLFWKPFCDEFRYEGKEHYVIKKTFEKDRGSGQVDVAFMPGTRTNVCENMLDLHIDKGFGEKLALRFCLADNGRIDYTFSDLRERVCQCAVYLSDQGIHYGTEQKDRVLLYLPKCPERIIYVLACFRIGVPVGVVHPRTSQKLLKDQVKHSGCTVLVTGGTDVVEDIGSLLKVSEIAKLKKKILLDCLKHHEIEGTAVAPCFCDKSKRVETSLNNMSPAKFDAERPLFYIFTSGTTGKSKTVEHAAFGYMVYTAVTYRFFLDFGIAFDDRVINDVSFCTADLAWIYGMTVGLCGPLLCGGTAVMYEGSLESFSEDTSLRMDVAMRIIDECKVTHFCTVPAGVMDLKNCDNEEFSLKNTSLAVITSVGSPFTRELHEKVFDFLKRHNLRFTDIWWQTETGSFIMGCPAKIDMGEKPSSSQLNVISSRNLLPFYGIKVDVKNAPEKETHQLVASGRKESRTAKRKGELCITQPWPSCIRRYLGNEKDQLSLKFDLGDFDEQNSLAFKSGDWVEEYGDKVLSYRIKSRIDEWLRLADSEFQYQLNAVEVEEILAPRARSSGKGPKILQKIKEAAVRHSHTEGSPDNDFRLAIFVEARKIGEGYWKHISQKDIGELNDYLRSNIHHPQLPEHLVKYLVIMDHLPIEKTKGKKKRNEISQTEQQVSRKHRGCKHVYGVYQVQDGLIE